MARKRLIKGANATRVEERIARVPADVLGASPGESIFGALRAMESSAPSAQPTVQPTAQPPAPPAAPKPAAKRPSARRVKAAKAVALKAEAPKQAAPLREAAPTAVPESATPVPAARDGLPLEGDRRKQARRLSPSDFTAAERAEIVRCCADYRNRLPTYLLAVQYEVEVIDSVIDKCRTPKDGDKKP